MDKIILLITALIISSLTLPKFGARYFLIIAQNNFNTTSSWNKNIDKPRIFIYSLSIIFILFVFNIDHASNIYIYWVLYALKIFSLLVTGYFCNMTWKESFKSKLIPKIINKIEKIKNNNFHLKLSNKQLTKLYNLLKNNNFLDYEKTSLENFIEALTKDFNTHSSKIYFKFSGRDINIFQKHLFKDRKKLKLFIETSSIVVNAKTNNSYSFKSVNSNSLEITTYSDVIKKIFNEINMI